MLIAKVDERADVVLGEFLKAYHIWGMGAQKGCDPRYMPRTLDVDACECETRRRTSLRSLYGLLGSVAFRTAEVLTT
jgi:hypothetical protein